MARINGVNSDYQFDDGTGQITEVYDDSKTVAQNPPVEMKLFICPYNKPNGLEDLDGESSRCEGTNTSCPNPVKTGHAHLHLHTSQGAILQADNDNRIQVDQAGDIQLSPSSGGEVLVDGIIRVKRAGQSAPDFTIEAKSNEVWLESSYGSKIVFRSNGNIDLYPATTSDTVRVRGKLQVDGTINNQPMSNLINP